jgi:hypothetical protein
VVKKVLPRICLNEYTLLSLGVQQHFNDVSSEHLTTQMHLHHKLARSLQIQKLQNPHT